MLGEMHQTLANSLKEVEDLMSQEDRATSQIDERLKRLSKFQAHVAASIASIQKQVARLKEDVKEFCQNETKLGQDLPPIAADKIEALLNGIELKESVSAGLNEIDKQCKDAKKVMKQKLKEQAKRLRRKIRDQISGQPKQHEITQHSVVKINPCYEPSDRTLKMIKSVP
jgi:chromosome segregation ATPase